MRYVAVEAGCPEVVQEIDRHDLVKLLVDKGVHQVNAKGLTDYLPCGVKLGVADLTIQRIA